jgi:hypothetical protein
MRQDLFQLCGGPQPFRKANYTRPGHTLNSLAETDAYIRGELDTLGYEVITTTHQAQAFRCDEAKPLHHWYATPDPTDPFYNISNLETTRRGQIFPERFIQLISHKDSMSWIDSPGAHDNAVGTAANLELARILANCELRHSVRVLFCNEEHTPWTSRFAAEAAAEREDNIIAVLNNDSLDGKSDEDMAAEKMSHVICYSTAEGLELARKIESCALRYNIDINVDVAFKETVNDDDGMLINAGFRRTVINLGSWPYADSEYHLPGDTFDRVNMDNLVRSTQLILAAVLELDEEG